MQIELHSQKTVQIVTDIPHTEIVGKDYGNLKWYQVRDIVGATFYDVKRAFHKEWFDRPYEKHMMIKQYRRWEHSVAYDEQGNFVDNQEIIRKWRKENESDLRSSIISNWQSLGPTNAPPATPSYPFSSTDGIGRVNDIAFDHSNANVYYVSSPGGGIWKTINNGSSWMALADNFPSMTIISISTCPTNSNIIWACVSGEGMYKSTDAGTTWNLTNLNFNNSLFPRVVESHPSNDQIAYVGTSNGLYRTTDQGSTWTNIGGYSGNIWDIKFKPNDVNTIYICGDNQVHKSTNAGSTFSVMSISGISAANRIDLAVTTDNPNVLYVFAGGYTTPTFVGLFKSSDSGASFVKVADHNSQTLAPAGNMAPIPCCQQIGRNFCIAVSPVDEDEIYLGHVSMNRSRDGGATWKSLGQYNPWKIHSDNNEIDYHPTTNIPIVVGDGGVYEYSADNTIWTVKNNGLAVTQSYSMGISQHNSNSIAIGNQDNGIMYKDASWIYVHGGDGDETTIDPWDDNILLGGTQENRETLISFDKGDNWETIFGTNISGESSINWPSAPSRFHPKLRHVIYVLHENLWKSMDYGQTWINVSNGLIGTNNKEEFVISESNPDVIYITRRNASTGFYKTTDAGVTWTSLTFPSGNFIYQLVIDPNDENHLFARGTYKVFESTDGALSWNDISSGLPSDSKRSIVFQEGTDELYLGNNIGVFHYDSGTGWSLYSSNLPSTPTEDLKINYCTNEIYAATYGRGSWKSPLNTPNTGCCLSMIPTISATSNQLCNSMVSITSSSAPSGMSYVWYRDDVLMAGETTQTISVSQEGIYSCLFFNGNCYTEASDPVSIDACTCPINALCKSFVNLGLDNTGSLTIIPAYIDNGSTVNCGTAALSLSRTNFDCNDLGYGSVDLIVTDSNGNSASCSSPINILELHPPIVQCNDITLSLDATGVGSVSTSHVDNGSYDNCGIDSYILSQENFDCSNLGSNSVSLEVLDVSGNSSNCSVDINVIDNLPPTLNCNDLTISLDAMGSANITFSDIDGGTSDNCSLASTTLDRYTFDCSDLQSSTATSYSKSLNSSIITSNSFINDHTYHNGKIYMSKRPSDQILVYDMMGSLLSTFGGSGSGPGQFGEPEAIAFDSNDNIYISDRISSKIVVFDPIGSFLYEFSTPPVESIFIFSDIIYAAHDNAGKVSTYHLSGGFIQDLFTMPAVSSIYIENNLLYAVTNSASANIEVRDLLGVLQTSFSIGGWANDISADDCGNIHVARWNDSVHSVYDMTGALISTYSTSLSSSSNFGNLFLGVDLFGKIFLYDVTCAQAIYSGTYNLLATATDGSSNSSNTLVALTLEDPLNACSCQTNITESSIPITDGFYQSKLSINSAGLVPAGGDVSFGSTTICLDNGFEISLGALFEAKIDPCMN